MKETGNKKIHGGTNTVQAVAHGETGFGINQTLKFGRLRKFILLILPVIAFVIGITLFTLHTLSAFSIKYDEEHMAMELTGILMHYDEILTMSAEMAASTGDLKWEERYRTYEPGLDAAINEVRTLYPEIFKETIAQTKDANIELVEIENAAFKLVREGNNKAASKLLDNDRYEKQKQLYKNGIIRFEKLIQQQATVNLAKARHIMLEAVVVKVIITACIIVLYLTIIAMHKLLLKHRQVEKSLQISEQRYRNLFESMDEGFALCEMIYNKVGKGIDFRYLDVNPAFAKQTGLTTEKILGRKITEVIPGIEPFWIEAFDRVIKTGISERLCHNVTELERQYEVYAWRAEAGRFAIVFSDVTERKMAEQRLKENEARLAVLFESNPTGLVLIEKESRKIVQINSAAAKMIGLSKENIVGKICHGFICPAERNSCPICDLGQKVDRSERILKNSDGEQIPILKTVEKIMLDGKEYLLESFIDITDRKKAAEAILKAKNEWEDTFNSINDVVTIHDKDLNIVRANKAALTTFGLSAQELIGKKCFQVYHHKNCPPEGCPSCMINKTGKSITREYYEPALDCYVEVKAYPRFDDKNNIIGIIHVAKDITELKKTEQELKNLARFPSENPFPVLRLSKEGIILYSNNPGMILLNNWGRDIKETIPLDRQKIIEDVLAGGQTKIEEIEFPGKVFSFATVPIMEEGYANMYGCDITMQKQAEQTLENLNKHLKATVEKLTIANRELRNFAHIIAHDLKTPLRGIGALTEFLFADYTDKFDEEGQKSVNLLIDRVNNMYAQIDYILKYSEIGREVIRKENVDLNVLIREVIGYITIPENIKVVIDNNLPSIVCERTHLTQIFKHLINNAINYMDKPSGLITISYSQSNVSWKFSVADNGPGIENKYFEKIFQIFQTLATSDEKKRTGIGLAVVKKIIEIYGGRIWIESTKGQGATFLFTLPKQKQEVFANE